MQKINTNHLLASDVWSSFSVWVHCHGSDNTTPSTCQIQNIPSLVSSPLSIALQLEHFRFVFSLQSFSSVFNLTHMRRATARERERHFANRKTYKNCRLCALQCHSLKLFGIARTCFVSCRVFLVILARATPPT